MIEGAAIKKASELTIDTSGCRMQNNEAQLGESPRNASIALPLAFVTHLFFNAFSCSQNREENGSHRREPDRCR